MAGETAGREWWSKPNWLHLVLCASAALTVLLFGNPLETQERQWFGQVLRWRFALGLSPAVERSIVHLNIDAEDIQKLSTLESEYAAAARIIHEASSLGASVIAFDIIFARGSPQVAQPLVDAIELRRNVVLAEALSAPPGTARTSVRIRSFPFRDTAPAPAGLINLSADPDGVIRQYQLVHKTQDGYQPSLALAVYLTSLGLDWKRDVSLRLGADHVEWKELSSSDYASLIRRRVPLRPVLLNLRCPWSVETGSAAFDYLNVRQLDALFAKTPTDAPLQPLRNRIVFVSYVATGQGDLGATVFGPHEPLIYLHSNALNDLMQSRWLQKTGRLGDALWICSALLVLVGAHFCRSKWTLILWWVLGVAALVAIAGSFLLQLNLVVPSVATASLWTLATVLEIARRHTSELVQRQRLRNTMGLYFSPRVLKYVLENPGSLEPKRVEITVLLTDLRNSTALAELLGTEGMLELLNRVFTVENSAVFAEDGNLENPVGDQFLAYWGAPDPQPDSADRALRAALALINGLESLRETLEPRTRELFGYGVALHAGQSLIANIGSSKFLHYGVVGDLINATARVESLTRFYGVTILATREVYDRITQPPESRLIDRVVVKGKSTPLELNEIRNKCSGENFVELTKQYGHAFDLYEQGQFAQAGKLFRALSASDKASSVLAERCAQLHEQPPSEWHGVFSLSAK
jgi:class 3 adenylate cyclase/CHASE2 domain-containing sensor protein